MSRKVVYVTPGEILEVRLVGEGYGKNAREWNEQVRPCRHLVRVWPQRITTASRIELDYRWSDEVQP